MIENNETPEARYISQLEGQVQRYRKHKEDLLSQLAESRQEAGRLRDALDRLIEAASNVTVSTVTDFNKGWAEKLEKAIDEAISATPNTKAFAERVQIMEEVLEAVALPPYPDSDLASLLGTLRKQAIAALARLEEVRKS